LFTAVRLSEAYDAVDRPAQREDRGVDATVDRSEGEHPRFALSPAKIGAGRSCRPVETHDVVEVDPMFGEIRDTFRLVPFVACALHGPSHGSDPLTPGYYMHKNPAVKDVAAAEGARS
jgi:hypothetical protein